MLIFAPCTRPCSIVRISPFMHTLDIHDKPCFLQLLPFCTRSCFEDFAVALLLLCTYTLVMLLNAIVAFSLSRVPLTEDSKIFVWQRSTPTLPIAFPLAWRGAVVLVLVDASSALPSFVIAPLRLVKCVYILFFFASVAQTSFTLALDACFAAPAFLQNVRAWKGFL